MRIMRLSRRALLAATTAAATFSSAPPATAADHHKQLRTGFENLAATGYAQLDGQRLGIVTNPRLLHPK